MPFCYLSSICPIFLVPQIFCYCLIFFFFKYCPHPRSTESETLRVKPNNLGVFCLFVCFLKLIPTLFIYLFLAVLGLRFVRGLSLVAASRGHSSSWCGGHSSSRCTGLSLSWPLPLRGTGSRRAGSAVVAHRPSCSVACGIFPDQGSNPCPLH